ncbi:hypothetical protein B484DRAFT_252334 [Ochromonadaceae sp. CCMP2298]|nr:hypothetical protein B484DRAFT_252334 [Ochromonadaceae sp. CCMP2298]|eukprot:CAMPEP_0173253204 /NCGR_PEP_ID=MMETSP1142-20121109/21187_1 /TAXON_ID=483371 /ORGANISM="non described non described, Strain CCMP2298" /LENGTH=434 /DNA_ID=CAMNT_0014186401 /DNA_START=56 /DNA_END=1360 /DNA_ORIENTATION=+
MEVLKEKQLFQLACLMSTGVKMPLTLEQVLEASSELIHEKIPDSVLNVDTYCKARNTRNSVEVVSEISSGHSGIGVLKFTKFKLSAMPSNRRPILRSFAHNAHKLENLVKDKFSGNDFMAFMSDLETKLDELRAIVYSIFWVDGTEDNAVWPESRLQKLLQLFLDYMFKAWFGETSSTLLSASSATTYNIQLTVHPDSGGEDVEYAGHSDIRVDMQSGADSFPENIVELKVAFSTGNSRLYHSEASPAKQQFLCQSMGLLQMSGKPCSLSYLTDLMAISVLHLRAGEEIPMAGQAHLSNRVTDRRQYCLLLLLMCFEVSESDWTSLGADHNSLSVFLDDEEAASTTGFEEKIVNKSSSKHNTRSGKGRGEAGSGRSRTLIPIVDADEEAGDRRLADILNMNRWQAKRTGVPFLCQKELQDNIRSASDRTAAFFT